MTEPGSTLVEEPGESRSAVYTIEVRDIPEDLLRRLDERARERGSDRSDLVRDILARELGAEETDLAHTRFDAALAPLREGFAESDLSEEEATALLETGLRATRQERRQARTTPESEENGR